MTTVITLVRDPGVQLRLLHSEFVNFLVCQVCSVNLMDGDMIVSGSDGLFDNIFDQEIISIISESSGVDEAGKFLASTKKAIRPKKPTCSTPSKTMLNFCLNFLHSESIGRACKKTFS